MDVIRNALETICASANTYLENIDNRGDAWVVLTSMVDHDGSINQAAKDKIVMTMYGMTRESVIPGAYYTMNAEYRAAEPGLAVINPPLYVNLHLSFMANFVEKNYPDGLAALSRIMDFFQQNPLFTHDNAQSLAPSIDRLSIEFESLGPVDVNYIMGMLGTNYLPSVFYKLRMLPFAANVMQARTYPVTTGSLGNAGGTQ